jgi:MOSC domain-containing protein YiiM
VTSHETCDECGFDAGDWQHRDVADLFDALGEWWQLATDGLSADELNQRPAPRVWSALEYGLHIALVTAVIRSGIEMILASNECTLPSVPETGSEDPLHLDPDEILVTLAREGSKFAALARQSQAAWGNVGDLDGSPVEAEAALLHAAHDASHHLMDVGRGIGAKAGAGTVVQINTSGGGVPKTPIAGGQIDTRGLEGDHQADRKHHGRPYQAVCLWSADVIAELADAGHPVAAGSAGENLTVSGIAWPALRPGMQLRAGTALLEISFPATPCAKQTRWFSDGDFARISHERHPEWVRWYAWVREAGSVQVGDPVG